MGKLVVLMVTAFVDMMGGLIVFPLIPFYAEKTLGHGPLWSALNAVGLGGSGAAVSLMVMMVAGAQLNFGALKAYGRYNIGLANINDIGNQDSWKSQQFQLGIGLRIF